MRNTERGRRIALRVEVDDQDLRPQAREGGGDVDGRRGLPHAALLVRHRQDARLAGELDRCGLQRALRAEGRQSPARAVYPSRTIRSSMSSRIVSRETSTPFGPRSTLIAAGDTGLRAPHDGPPIPREEARAARFRWSPRPARRDPCSYAPRTWIDVSRETMTDSLPHEAGTGADSPHEQSGRLGGRSQPPALDNRCGGRSDDSQKPPGQRARHVWCRDWSEAVRARRARQ